MRTRRLSSAAVLALLGFSAAHPQGTRGVKREVEADKMVITEASLKEPTEVPQVVVYVDEEGKPLTTSTETVLLVPPSRAPLRGLNRLPKPADLKTRSGDVSSRATYQSYSSYDLASSPPTSVSKTSSAAPSSQSPSSSSSSAPSSSVSSSAALYGVAYAPYTGTGGCKTPEQIDADFTALKGKYSVVRIYGTDCDQVANALPAAKKAGLKLFLGLFEIGPIAQQVQTIVSAVKGDWSAIDTVSVGNELVNSGKATAEQVTTAMTQTRKLLRAAGYKGPVVTVDTFVAVLANPSLCDLSDYCAINIHPFFDGNTLPDAAGPFVAETVSRVQAKLSNRNKRIICTETGWPWKGDSNKAAVPGLKEQKLAVDSIKKAFASHPSDVFLLSAFNDLWKHSEASTFHAEQYWGIEGLNSASDRA